MDNVIKEIKAEMLLNYLYPEKSDAWEVRYRSDFARGYSAEILNIDADGNVVELARNGFLKLLPKEMMAPEQEFSKNADYEAIHRRIRMTEEAFLPIDVFAFRENMEVERTVTEILDERFSYLMTNYFGIDYRNIMNPYLKTAVTLLPSVAKHRGDLKYVQMMLKTVMKSEVEMNIMKYRDVDSPRVWLPMVRYDIIVEGLDREQYLKMKSDVDELARFVDDWYIGAEVVLKVRVRSREKGNILGYNF